MKLAEMTDGMQCRWSGMLSLEPAPRVNIERLTVTSRNHNNYDSAIRRASRANWVTGVEECNIAKFSRMDDDPDFLYNSAL